MGCPQTSVSLLVQVLHLPSSCLGGTCCQWDQSGVFAGLNLVWTSLTFPFSCSQPSGCWGTLVAALLVALPSASNACGGCDTSVCGHGFVCREQSLPGGYGALGQDQGWPDGPGCAGQDVLLTRAGLCFPARPALPTALLLQKVVQGAEMVGSDPTLAWLLVPGTFWVEGGHGPQALACIFCGSKASPVLASSPG